MGICRAILPLLALSLAAWPAGAADSRTNATLSYKKLDDFFQMVESVDSNKLSLRMSIASTNRSVHASNITLTVQSAKGTFPVILNATNGRIVGFPHRPDLVHEDPPIVVNQPKGSMQTWIQLEIPLHDRLTFRYARLADGVAEVNGLVKKQAGFVLGLLAPRVDAVVFYFPRKAAGKARLTIATASGLKEFVADQTGRIRLKVDKTLLAENPEVTLSEPATAIPDVEPLFGD